ncbi:MAG: SxtJ family membrane protein [Bacteroidia bacterium]
MQSQAQIWKTILVLVIANLIAFVIWRYQALLYVAIGLGVLSLLSPQLAKWIHIGWMKLAEGLGWVNSRILLGLVFFLLLTPIALLVRLFRKDPLQLKRPQSSSLFHERNHLFQAEDLKNPW